MLRLYWWHLHLLWEEQMKEKIKTLTFFRFNAKVSCLCECAEHRISNERTPHYVKLKSVNVLIFFLCVLFTKNENITNVDGPHTKSECEKHVCVFLNRWDDTNFYTQISILHIDWNAICFLLFVFIYLIDEPNIKKKKASATRAWLLCALCDIHWNEHWIALMFSCLLFALFLKWDKNILKC